MLTRHPWRAVVVAGLIALAAWGGWMWSRPVRHDNILLITLDTTRADRLGCYGYQKALTPVLDRLANEGVLFERAYTPVPLTLPAHATILTGLQPPEHGLHGNGQAALPATIPTLATELKSAGYETGAFVAAFVLDRKFGLTRGFDVYDDDLSGAEGDPHGHHRYRKAETVLDAARRWIGARNSKPFFCWIHLFDPHFPYLDHADRFGQQFADRPYDAELAYVDAELGRLFEFLEKQGFRERTLIVVVGDHGESLGEHGELAHSMTVYNATLHVPLIVSRPGEAPGRRVATPVTLADVGPTLLECASRKPLRESSGRSLLPALRGEATSERPWYAETDEPWQTARWSPLRAWMTSRWKYVRSPQPELYDLDADPHELANLAALQPGQLQEMERALEEYEAALQKRAADGLSLSGQDRQDFRSLGYASGGRNAPAENRPLRDVKEMLPYYNLLNDANAMMDAGRYDLAEPVLRKIIAADEEFFLAHGDLGRCLLQQNRPREAVPHLKRSVELDPGADRVRAQLGAALFLAGDAGAAIEALETALETSPDLFEARYNLGLALEQVGRTKDALEQFEACLNQRPDSEPVLRKIESLRTRRP